MDAAIIDQPDLELLSSLEDRVCEDVIELDMFRSTEKVIIQEKSQRLGGLIFYTSICIRDMHTSQIFVQISIYTKLYWLYKICSFLLF